MSDAPSKRSPKDATAVGERPRPPQGAGAAHGSPLQNSPVEELLGLVEAEAEAATDAKRAADLKARAALLLWDGKGMAERALATLNRVDHPVSPALRLGLVVSMGEWDGLAALAAEARRRGDRAELAEIAAFLLWSRGSLDVAGELFRLALDDGKLGRRLTLAVAGRWAELVELLGEARDADTLAEASALAQDRLGDVALAAKLAERGWERQSRSLHAIERLIEVQSPPTAEVLLGKLSTIGIEPTSQG